MKYNREQLERKYAKQVEYANCNNYFEFVINCYEMSSAPHITLRSWTLEMKRECKKQFLKFALSYLDLTSNHNMQLVSRIIDEI